MHYICQGFRFPLPYLPRNTAAYVEHRARVQRTWSRLRIQERLRVVVDLIGIQVKDVLDGRVFSLVSGPCLRIRRIMWKRSANTTPDRPVPGSDLEEVVVVLNLCPDKTAEIARGFGARTIREEKASPSAPSIIQVVAVRGSGDVGDAEPVDSRGR